LGFIIPEATVGVVSTREGIMALYLEPEAIDQCVSVCDEMLDMIDKSIQKADKLQNTDVFGGFRIGEQLSAGYAAKAVTVVERLREYEVAVLAMREAFASGGAAFADTDGNFAKAMAAFQSGVDA